MKKPKGEFGTGVSLMEISLVVEKMTDRFTDHQYLRLLLRAAHEKLLCIQKKTKSRSIKKIIERPEWIQ